MKSVTKIGEYALGYCQDFIPGMDASKWISIGGFTIYGYKGTIAEKYANENEFKFEPLDKETDPTADFTDAAKVQKHWGYENIVYTVKHGIMKGNESKNGVSFDPENLITRAQIVAILHNLEGNPTAKSSGKFKDVAKGA